MALTDGEVLTSYSFEFAIDGSGALFWKGERVTREEAVERFAEAGRLRPQPEVYLRAVQQVLETDPQAQALMLKLAQYPQMLSAAAQDFAPHDVTFYLRELASLYHSYYDAERILVDDETIRKARLALVAATAQVLHNGLQVLGVSAPTKM